MRMYLIAAAAISFAAPAHADCTANLQAILTGSLAAGPYVMEMTTADITMTAEFVPPGALHAVTKIGGSAQEITVTGGKAWMKMGGNWTPMPDTLATQMTSAIGGAAEMMEQVTSPQCLGMQDFEGKAYLAFKYDYAAPGVATSSTMYVDPATKLPAIVVGTSTAAGKSTDTRATYRYDPAVTVTAPM